MFQWRISVRHLLYTILLALTGCGGPSPLYRNMAANLGIAQPSVPVPGNTLASKDLQQDVANILAVREGVANEACKTYAIKNTDILEPPHGLELKWKELWTVDRCGTSVTWHVEFTPDPQGGTNFGTRRATQ